MSACDGLISVHVYLASLNAEFDDCDDCAGDEIASARRVRVNDIVADAETDAEMAWRGGGDCGEYRGVLTCAAADADNNADADNDDAAALALRGCEGVAVLSGAVVVAAADNDNDVDDDDDDDDDDVVVSVNARLFTGTLDNAAAADVGDDEAALATVRTIPHVTLAVLLLPMETNVSSVMSDKSTTEGLISVAS